MAKTEKKPTNAGSSARDYPEFLAGLDDISIIRYLTRFFTIRGGLLTLRPLYPRGLPLSNPAITLNHEASIETRRCPTPRINDANESVNIVPGLSGVSRFSRGQSAFFRVWSNPRDRI